MSEMFEYFQDFVEKNLGTKVVLFDKSPKLQLYFEHFKAGLDGREQPLVKVCSYSYTTDDGDVVFNVDRSRDCDLLFKEGSVHGC
jgi:hypothetical protein